MIDFGPVERMLRNLRAADDAEREGCRQWIDAVKRRLGLIGPDDDAAARMAQWEHDHLTVEDLPVALCAGGRVLDSALTLELAGERVAEIRAHPYLAGNDVLLYRPVPIPWPEPASGYLSSGYLWGRT